MASFVWNPALSGNFSGLNWLPSGAPGPGDSATLGGTAAYLTIVDTKATAAYGGVLLSDPAAELLVSNPFTANLSQTAGTLLVASTLQLGPAQTWSGGSLVLSGKAVIIVPTMLALAASEAVVSTDTSFGTITGAGALVTAGTVTLGSAGLSPFSNILIVETGGFTNTGQISVVSGSAVEILSGAFVNSGTVSVAPSAILAISDISTISNFGAGRLTLASGSELFIFGATLTTNALIGYQTRPGNSFAPGYLLTVGGGSLNNAGSFLDFSSPSGGLPTTALEGGTVSGGFLIGGSSLVVLSETLTGVSLQGTFGANTTLNFSGFSAQLVNSQVGVTGGGSQTDLFNIFGLPLLGTNVVDNADLVFDPNSTGVVIGGTSGSASLTLGPTGTIDSPGSGAGASLVVSTVDNSGLVIAEAAAQGTVSSTFSIGSTAFVNEASGRVLFTNGEIGQVSVQSLTNAGQIGAAGGAVVTLSGTRLTNSGTLFADSGTLVVTEQTFAGSGQFQVRNGGTLIYAVGSAVNPAALRFSGGGVISLPTVATFGGSVGSFYQGDTIVLPGIIATSASFGASSSLVIQATTTTVAFANVSAYSNSPTLNVTNGPGGATITTNGVCYAAGTRILTDRGERPVETLSPGDRVVTLRGSGVATIRWVGHQHIDVSRHAHPARVRPVRVRRDAFGAGRPHRDLVLSPEHAVFVDGALIPIRYLIDGRLVDHEPAVTIRYVHIELARHDIVLAEGLPAETWLDTGNRAMFDNGPRLHTLFPDFVPSCDAQAWDRLACARLLTGGPRMDAIRRRLAASADIQVALTHRA